MELEAQGVLVEIPEQPVPQPPPVPKSAVAERKPKVKPIDRDQGLLRSVIVDELVAPDHKVRAIWDLTGQLDLSGIQAKIRSREGQVGRAAWDPRLLLSVWLYAYSEQVTSAREIEGLMAYEPGLMWLSGLGEVNHHTLSDFRADHPEELKTLLAELLGVLSQEGYVKLECVAHDGTKIRAQAGGDSFRRGPTLEKEIAKAQQMVEALDGQPEIGQAENPRREAARRRAARERSERMKQASEELKKIRAGKRNEPEQQEARVSLTEPEARMMKHGDNAIAPSYNVQITTDAEETIIVGMHLTQCSSDSGSLAPAMEQVQEMMGRYPEQVVADGGFTNQASIAAMNESRIDFYGSLPEAEVRQAASMKAAGIDPAFAPSFFQVQPASHTLQCPAGKILVYLRQSKKGDQTYFQYRAQASDCSSCEYQKRCCPRPEEGRLVSIRMTENAEVAAFREKMKTEAARAIYKKRGGLAEFPNCWIKEKLGMRKFRLRGLAKATTEALWGVLTYDVMQWLRLSWRPKYAAMGAVGGGVA
jgi:transposase